MRVRTCNAKDRQKFTLNSICLINVSPATIALEYLFSLNINSTNVFTHYRKFICFKIMNRESSDTYIQHTKRKF